MGFLAIVAALLSAMSRSADLVVRLMDGTTQLGRGEHMQVVLQFEWLDHAKVGELGPDEAAFKHAVWVWFSALERAALDRVRSGVERGRHARSTMG